MKSATDGNPLPQGEVASLRRDGGVSPRNRRRVAPVAWGMRFTKMQGVGNDFVVLDAAALPPDADLGTMLAITLCERHFGAGADGLLVVGRDAPGAAFSMRMFNPDGTEDMCGNGLRCVGLWAHRAGWVTAMDSGSSAWRPKRVIEGDAASGSRAEDGQVPAVCSVGMGVPQVRPGRHSVLRHPAPPELGAEGAALSAIRWTDRGNVLYHGDEHGQHAHGHLRRDVPPDEETFQRVSPLIETHPQFPERTSRPLGNAPGRQHDCRAYLGAWGG